MKRRAAQSGGGWVLPPPISRHEAEQVFGAAIPTEAWKKITRAFSRHGQNLDALDTSTSNKNKNDPNSWTTQKFDAEKKLANAIDSLTAINRKFIREVADNLSLQRSGGLEIYYTDEKLNKAIDEAQFIAYLVQSSEGMEIQTPSDSESRKQLACDVFEALKPHGATVSDGRRFSEMNGVSEANLTGFEQLIGSLEIHLGDTPLATAKWTRGAVAQKQG
jgi:hypothetical protein